MKRTHLYVLIGALLTFGMVQADTTPLEINVPVQASHLNSTTLRFEMELPAPGVIHLEVIGWESTLNWSVDYDRVYIYNSSGEPIGMNEFGSEEDPFLFHMISDSAVLITRVGMEGTYYIDFHSGSDWGWPEEKTMQGYTVTLTMEEAIDPAEPNDQYTDAQPLSIGQTFTGCQWKRIPTLSVWGDDDWYSVETPTPGILTVQLDDWISVYNWSSDYDRFYIYNEEMEPIGVESSDPEDPYHSWMMEGEPGLVEVNITTAGRYYMNLHAGNGYSHEGYSVTPTFLEVDDQFEPNDDFDTAAEIEFGVTYDAYQWRSLGSNSEIRGDEDYYLFNLPSAGELVIYLDNWEAIYNWSADYDRLIFYDSTQTVVGTDPYSWMMGGGEEISIEFEEAGQYYARFHSGRASSTEPYQIRFEFSPAPGTTVQDENAQLPTEFGLRQNYPNPFNPATTIRYALPRAAHVHLTVYDIRGNTVTTMVDQHQPAGYYSVHFDGTALASGTYIYKLTAGGYVETRKMVVMK